jgi:uracil-DNA glycosylase
MREQNEEYARPTQPPDTSSLATVREAAAYCTACYLYQRGTLTVFGEGPKRAAMVLVGEQPGDYEDVAGKPFVGPAGKIMDRALADAGIDRSQVYVTNAVKHFKWESRGKRRISPEAELARNRSVPSLAGGGTADR